jgi:hypothetical protein
MTHPKSFSERKNQHSKPLKSFALWFCGEDPTIAAPDNRQQVERLRRVQNSQSILSANQTLDGFEHPHLEVLNVRGIDWKDRIFPPGIAQVEKEQGLQQVDQKILNLDVPSSRPSKEKLFQIPESPPVKSHCDDLGDINSTVFIRERHFLERCFFGDLLDQEQFLSQLNANELIQSLAVQEPLKTASPLLSQPRGGFYRRWLRQLVISSMGLTGVSPRREQKSYGTIAAFPTAAQRSASSWLPRFIQPKPIAIMGVLSLPILLSSARVVPEFKSVQSQSFLNFGQRSTPSNGNVVRLKWNESAANIPSYLLLPGFRPPQGRFSQEKLNLQTGRQNPVLPPKPAGTHQSIPLRVAIASGSGSVTLQPSKGGLITDEQGNPLGQIAPNTSLMVQTDGLGISLDRFYANSVLWIKSPDPSGLIGVNGQWYRGTIQLKIRGTELLAVNHVELEQYLYSVVGKEMMPSWPLDALKAQAVAARSYATAHIVRPANQDFDIGATAQWQAYPGFEQETDSTRAAVDETRGLLLSYKDNIVETLYASSDSLVQEAHQGFGMSQEGALGLAEQGFNYQQILNYFYPGTRLAWLQLSQ